MQLNKNHGRITCLKLRNCSIGSTKWAPCHKSRSLFLSELWWVHLQSWGRWGTWLSSERKLPMTPPHTVRAVKHGWSIYHPSCIRWGKKKMSSSKAVLASDLWFTVKWRKNNHMDLPQIACQSSFFCCQKRMFSGVDSIWTKYSLAIPVLCRKIATIFP